MVFAIKIETVAKAQISHMLTKGEGRTEKTEKGKKRCLKRWGGGRWRGDLLFFFLPHRRLKDALPVRYYKVGTGDGRLETGGWII
ncbi:MAG: hypothetical protein V3T23_10230 [Nitrososphaerales archaeon]